MIQATLIGEAVDNGPYAIFVADDTGRYVAVNTVACDLLGYSRGELLNLTVHELAPTEPVADRFAEIARDRGLTGITDLRHKDGSNVSIEWRATRTTVAGMEFLVSFALPV